MSPKAVLSKRKIHYEDAIFKHAMDVFGKDALDFFKIPGKIKSIAATELVALQIKNLLLDYVFEMEDDSLIHLEFQSTNKGITDLRRFRAYEALLSFQREKEVITYVIFTGDIKNPQNTLINGKNEYAINVISMAEKNGDLIFESLKEKLDKNDLLTKEELLTLSFTPLMGSKLKTYEKIKRAVDVTKQHPIDFKQAVQAILLAFSEKFLMGQDLKKIKEALKMSEIAREFIEEGERRGLQKGRQEMQQEMQQEIEKEKIQAVKKGLMKAVPLEDIALLTGLSLEKIKEISNKIH